MSIVVKGRNRGGERESAWREETLAPAAESAAYPSTDSGRGEMYQMDVSLKELQLLLRLRMLEAGEIRLVVVKTMRGMVGLREWRVESGEGAGG